MNLIGWIGSFCLAYCGIPQAIKCIKEGNSNGIDLYFLITWFIGEVLSLIYVYSLDSKPLPLITNYFINILVLIIILKYKLNPRNKIMV